MGKLTLCLDAFAKYLYFISKASGIVVLFFMTVLVAVDVLGRATIGKTTLIAAEMSGYALVCIVFLGLVYTLKMGRHIRIEIVTRRLSHQRQQQLEIVVCTICIIFMAWFTWTTWSPVAMAYATDTRSSTVSRMPMWIPRLFVPVGAGMLTLGFLINLINLTKIRNLILKH